MMKIKFRGMGDNGWEYGYVVRTQFCAYDRDNFPECFNSEYIEEADNISFGYKICRDKCQSSVWVKKGTVGQYIGIKDRTGKEIYAGDKVKCPITSKSEDYLQLEAGKNNYVIRTISIPEVFQEGLPDDIKIIGNVYEEAQK